jgi:hypothetical protein
MSFTGHLDASTTHIVYFKKTLLLVYINYTKVFHCDISIYAYNILLSDQIHPLYLLFLSSPPQFLK